MRPGLLWFDPGFTPPVRDHTPAAPRLQCTSPPPRFATSPQPQAGSPEPPLECLGILQRGTGERSTNDRAEASNIWLVPCFSSVKSSRRPAEMKIAERASLQGYLTQNTVTFRALVVPKSPGKPSARPQFGPQVWIEAVALFFSITFATIERTNRLVPIYF